MTSLIYYHIDRTHSLSEGKLITLNNNFQTNNPNGQILIDKMFPSGISKHGEHYLNDSVYYFASSLSCLDNIFNSNTQNSIFFTEYTFELIRRIYFSNKPSRFTSLFAIEKLEDLKYWPEIYSKDTPVFEITTENKLAIFDGNYLKGGLAFSNNPLYQGFSASLNFEQALNYWSGKQSNSPKPEVLLSLPVTIGKRVL